MHQVLQGELHGGSDGEEGGGGHPHQTQRQERHPRPGSAGHRTRQSKRYVHGENSMGADYTTG